MALTDTTPALTRGERRRGKTLWSLKTDEMTTGALLSVIFSLIGKEYWDTSFHAFLAAVFLTWLGLSFSILSSSIRLHRPGLGALAVLMGVACGALFYIAFESLVKTQAAPAIAIITLYGCSFVAALVKTLVVGGEE